MCSISGFISSAPIGKGTCENLCSALLYYGADRGDQSAGIYINKKLFKRAVSTGEFLNLPRFAEMFSEPANLALLHTRQPTSGGRADKHAQPFRVNETITVHNGWFHNIQELKNQWTLQKKTNVDSELLTQFISSYGINLLPKFLSSSMGSSAFGIIHENELYLMRDSNPIHVATLKMTNGTNITVFASTPGMILNSLRYNWLIPNSFKINQIKEGILFKVSADGELTSLSEKVWSKHNYGGCGGTTHYRRLMSGDDTSLSNSNNYPNWWKGTKHDKDIEATYKLHKAIRENAINSNRSTEGSSTD